MNKLTERTNTLLFLSGLCLLCIAGGIQAADAMHLWLAAGTIRPSSLKLWSETLKAVTVLLFGFAIFCKLVLSIYRSNNLQSRSERPSDEA